MTNKDNGGPASYRELLEMSAKAAGYEVEWVRNSGCHYRCEAEESREQWCPLDDDGDALRLAVKLHLDIRFYWDGCDDQYNTVEAYTHGAKKDAEEPIGFYLRGGQIDEAAATRRAIVRAAAAIGSAM